MNVNVLLGFRVEMLEVQMQPQDLLGITSGCGLGLGSGASQELNTRARQPGHRSVRSSAWALRAYLTSAGDAAFWSPVRLDAK